MLITVNEYANWILLYFDFSMDVYLLFILVLTLIPLVVCLEGYECASFESGDKLC